ncbi:hypothetical protein IMZ48_25505 [Candidatus Bathyarchaeota archaeon]|nr:hypothetical protein [Candidatus Bathyarchaeota archaeon]
MIQAELGIYAPTTKPAIERVSPEELDRVHPASTLEPTTATWGDGSARNGTRLPPTLCNKGHPVPYPAPSSTGTTLPTTPFPYHPMARGPPAGNHRESKTAQRPRIRHRGPYHHPSLIPRDPPEDRIAPYAILPRNHVLCPTSPTVPTE